MKNSSNRLRPLALATLIAWCGMAMVACGGDAGPSSSGEQVPEPKVPVDRNLWNTAWNIATDSQRDALRDGEVTFAEYEAAALKTARCITDAGMQGEAILNTSTGSYEVAARYQSLGSVKADEGRRAASAACGEEHWLGINQAWYTQNQPSQQVLDQAVRALAQCLRESGLEVPDTADGVAVSAFNREPAWFPCVQRVGAEYGIPNYGGGN